MIALVCVIAPAVMRSSILLVHVTVASIARPPVFLVSAAISLVVASVMRSPVVLVYVVAPVARSVLVLVRRNVPLIAPPRRPALVFARLVAVVAVAPRASVVVIASVAALAPAGAPHVLVQRFTVFVATAISPPVVVITRGGVAVGHVAAAAIVVVACRAAVVVVVVAIARAAMSVEVILVVVIAPGIISVAVFVVIAPGMISAAVAALALRTVAVGHIAAAVAALALRAVAVGHIAAAVGALTLRPVAVGHVPTPAVIPIRVEPCGLALGRHIVRRDVKPEADGSLVCLRPFLFPRGRLLLLLAAALFGNEIQNALASAVDRLRHVVEGGLRRGVAARRLRVRRGLFRFLLALAGAAAARLLLLARLRAATARGRLVRRQLAQTTALGRRVIGRGTGGLAPTHWAGGTRGPFSCLGASAVVVRSLLLLGFLCGRLTRDMTEIGHGHSILVAHRVASSAYPSAPEVHEKGL